MPLSISSSETRRWQIAFALALALSASALLGWELLCRQLGVQASPVRDSPALWAEQRERAAVLGPEALILVGGSRMQLDINLNELGRHASHHPVQLAIDGAGYLPVLRDLAEDPRIRGTIIVSSTTDTLVKPEHPRAVPWVRYYHAQQQSRSPLFYRALEQKLRVLFDRLFPSRTLGIKPHHLVNKWRGGDPHINSYLLTFPDRSRQADYTKVPQPEFYHGRVRRNLGPSGSLAMVRVRDFEGYVSYQEMLVNRLVDRGARVILVRLPTDKAIWEIDEARYPRAVYWDRMARSTRAEIIHFRDYPELMQFDLPDGSHLDYRDAVPFTGALARIIFESKARRL